MKHGKTNDENGLNTAKNELTKAYNYLAEIPQWTS
ncbi:hypothetical protein KN1_13870 [Stygiolobus caldivivus]|uniref:Uncharacterized protein n=1 Tax=Stygiolobus caldivivus TaxID=2824673 RepID=A0A8D5U5T0_9CREN|nr:hypothetical protein KN1_13870 [Stygiolobus caldivivus]